NLIIQGQKKEYDDNASIKDILVAEKVETPQYVTVSVNDELYDVKEFDDIKLKDGDNIEFLYFMGGGSR
ncbi:MAG: sulfur carrier protein ThiS, partial [Firmicutes bacterium]|nr:sulfur carrier protein ThiS [Bacillota bacterium]